VSPGVGVAPQVGLEPTTLRLTAEFQLICPHLPSFDSDGGSEPILLPCQYLAHASICDQ
jgi:hypothetical protein